MRYTRRLIDLQTPNRHYWSCYWQCTSRYHFRHLVPCWAVLSTISYTWGYTIHPSQRSPGRVTYITQHLVTSVQCSSTYSMHLAPPGKCYVSPPGDVTCRVVVQHGVTGPYRTYIFGPIRAVLYWCRHVVALTALSTLVAP